MRDFNFNIGMPRQDQKQVIRYLKEIDNIRAAKALYDYLLLEGYDSFKQNEVEEGPF